ncbi:hypothetical protein WN943_011074 [Citrus x changshan-huyou]
MELKKENKSLLEQLDTLEKKKGGRRDEILRAIKATAEAMEEISSSGFEHGYAKGREDKRAAGN